MSIKKFTVEEIGDLLLNYGYIGPEEREHILNRERLTRATLQKRQGSSGPFASRGGGYDVLPPELIAEMHIPSALSPNRTIGEDLIYEVLARALGMRHVKIDPLKLDAKLVTSTWNRAFARRYAAVPVGKEGQNLLVAIANPFDLELMENIRRAVGTGVIPVLASKQDILRTITEMYGFQLTVRAAEREFDTRFDLGNLEHFVHLKNIDEIESNDQHVVNAVDYILHYATKNRASDIHIEPKRDSSEIRMRIDGVLHDIHSVPKKLHAPIISRIKGMGLLDIAEHRKPQDGRIKTGVNNQEIEIRISLVPMAFGEKAVLRLFDASLLFNKVEDLGFEEDERLIWENLARQPQGMVLVTGPTGSGKTTTLYSTLRMLARPEVNVTTIEDPVEMVVERFNQISVNPKMELSFAGALKYTLRQDPDIIMLGEIRDGETAENAMRAALTGHMVLSTLHTNDSVTAITRLRELGVESYLIADTLLGVLAQRLVRCICEECRQETFLGEDEMELLHIPAPPSGKKLRAYYGEGCVRCRNTGLYGRTGLYELLVIGDRLKRLVKTGAAASDLLTMAKQDGLVTLQDSAVRKLAKGVTSFGEVLRVLNW